MTKEQHDEQLRKAREFAAEYEQLCKRHGLRVGSSDTPAFADTVVEWEQPIPLTSYYVPEGPYLIAIDSEGEQ